jgi:hypothetical protein
MNGQSKGIIDTSLLKAKNNFSPHQELPPNLLKDHNGSKSHEGSRNHSSRRKHRHRSKYSTRPPQEYQGEYFEDRFDELAKYGERKREPEYITLTREAEKRKIKMKAQQKKREKAMKYKQPEVPYGKYGCRMPTQPPPYGGGSYGDGYGPPRENPYTRSGFSNGGQYKLKRNGKPAGK